MTRPTLFILAALSALTCLAADSRADVCSIRVRVSDAQGQPLDKVMVSLQMDSGGPPRTTRTSNGVAEFCDIGWGTFSITAGFETCGQVQVRHLYIQWTRTLEVPIVFKHCHGMEIVDGCLLMLRVVDEDGGPLSGARARVGHIINHVPSDIYGRIVEPLVFDKTTDVEVSRPGYQSHIETVTCDRQTVETERKVVLAPAAN